MAEEYNPVTGFSTPEMPILNPSGSAPVVMEPWDSDNWYKITNVYNPDNNNYSFDGKTFSMAFPANINRSFTDVVLLLDAVYNGYDSVNMVNPSCSGGPPSSWGSSYFYEVVMNGYGTQTLSDIYDVWYLSTNDNIWEKPFTPHTDIFYYRYRIAMSLRVATSYVLQYGGSVSVDLNFYNK